MGVIDQTIKFIADTGALQKGISGAIKTIGALGVAAAAAFGTLVVKSFQAAGDFEQNWGGAQVVFGEFAEDLKTKSATAFKDAGLSMTEYMATANKMGSLLQGAGFDQSIALNMTTEAMQRAADKASVMGIDVGSAMEAITGLTKGNYEMMDNLGASIDDTSIKAYALEHGLTANTNAMTKQEKIGVALKMFLEQTAAATGNYAKENDTLAGSMTTAKAAFTNFLSGQGSPDQLVESFTKAGDVIVRMAGEIIPRLIEGIGSVAAGLAPQLAGMLDKLIPAITEGIVKMAEAITENAPMIIDSLVTGFLKMVEALVPLLPKLVETGITVITKLIEGLATAAPTLIPIIVDALTKMIQALIDNLDLILDAGLQLLLGLAEGILKALPDLIAKLPDIIIGIVDFIIKAIPMIIEAGVQLLVALVKDLPTIITAIVDALPQIIDGLITAFTNPDTLTQIMDAGITLLTSLVTDLPKITMTILESVPKIVTSIGNGFLTYIEKIKETGYTLLISLVGKIGEIATKVASAIPEVITAIKNKIAGYVGDMKEAGLNLIKGMWQGISDAAGWVMGKIQGFMGDIMTGIKGFFGIKSPATRLRDEVGVEMAAGIGVGFVDRMKKVSGDINNSLKAAMPKTLATDIDITGGVGFGGLATISQSSGGGNPLLSVLSELSSVLKTLKSGDTLSIGNMTIQQDSEIGQAMLILADAIQHNMRKGPVPA